MLKSSRIEIMQDEKEVGVVWVFIVIAILMLLIPAITFNEVKPEPAEHVTKACVEAQLSLNHIKTIVCGTVVSQEAEIVEEKQVSESDDFLNDYNESEAK